MVVFGEVADHLSGVGVKNFGAAGDEDDPIFARGSGAVFDAAFGPVFAFDDALVAEVEEGLKIDVGFEDDVAASSAVAAVGSACGDVFFPSEGNHAIAAVACDELDFGLVDELHGIWVGTGERFGFYIIG